MQKIIINILLVIALVVGAYFYGKKSAKNEVLIKEVERVVYVDKKTNDIYSKPNANFERLLELMEANIL